MAQAETASTWDKNKRWTKEAPPAPADMPVDPADVIPAAGLVLSGEAQVRIAAIEETLDKAKRDLWKLCRDVVGEAPAIMAAYDPSAPVRGAAYVYDDSKTAEQNAELEKAHGKRQPAYPHQSKAYVYDHTKTDEQNAEAKAEWRRGQNRDAQGGYGREGNVAKESGYEGRPGYANPNPPAKYP